MNVTLPLDGITVLALEHAIAVPLCTRQLAELGARVIKVERRETGDFARAYDDRVNGLCSHFVWTNRSKQSLTLDLKHPQSTQILNKLVAQSDVVIQNLAPGVTDRLGLSFEKLHPQFDQLIVCDITGYGQGGPFEGKKAYDLLVQCEAGLLSVTGTPDDIVKSGISIADIAAGSQAYSSILAALIQRGKTGEGSHIEISLLEAMVEWMGFPLYYAFEGASAPPRSGADHASIYPYGAFGTADNKTIMLGIQNEREWLVFCEKVLIANELATDARFNSNSVRSENRQALKEIINEIFSHLELNAICQRLDAAQIAYAQVNDIEDVWNHPQLRELKRLVEVDTPEGIVPAFKPPGNNSSFEHRMEAVPALGQHTHEVLSDLGYSEDQISQFEADKVV